jgi:hypothetical protein
MDTGLLSGAVLAESPYWTAFPRDDNNGRHSGLLGKGDVHEVPRHRRIVLPADDRLAGAMLCGRAVSRARLNARPTRTSILIEQVDTGTTSSKQPDGDFRGRR